MKLKTKFKQTEIGMIPEEWEVKHLGDCIQLVRKQFLPTENDVRPYIGLEHIEQQNLKLISIGSSKDIESNKFEFKSGQILFGKLRPYFRKLVRPKLDGVCSTDIWVIDTKEGYENTFFFYFLADPRIIAEASNSSEGTRMPRARWDYLEQLVFPIPPLPEQRAIAKILSDLDAKIELNQQMNRILEAIGQAIFKHWFVDFEFPNEEGKPYKSSGGEMVYNEELGKEIPKGWEARPFSEVIDVNPNRKLAKNTIAKKVGMADLNPWQSCVESWQKEEYKSGPKFQNGDILFARITPSLEHGKTAFVSFLDEDETAFGSTEFIIFAPKIIQSNLYIFHLARSENVRDAAISAMTGSSGRQRVPDDLFDQLLICVPPSQIIEAFHKVVLPFFAEIAINANQNRSLAALRDSLLPKLMSGKIRVPVEVRA